MFCVNSCRERKLHNVLGMWKEFHERLRTFNWLVVWNIFYFSIYSKGNSSPKWPIFFRGVETTNQLINFPRTAGHPKIVLCILLRQCLELPAFCFREVILKPWNMTWSSAPESAHAKISDSQFWFQQNWFHHWHALASGHWMFGAPSDLQLDS